MSSVLRSRRDTPYLRYGRQPIAPLGPTLCLARVLGLIGYSYVFGSAVSEKHALPALRREDARLPVRDRVRAIG
jgi:hypothetical protein